MEFMVRHNVLNNMRMRFLFRVLLLAASVQTVSAQDVPVGTWRAWPSHTTVLHLTKKNDVIYWITQGGMFSYNYNTLETESFTTVGGLHGTNVTTIYHDTSSGKIFIGYDDGNVDYFTDPHAISRLTDIYRSEAFTSKKIWKFRSHEGLLYIATDFGIVVYDPSRKETRQSYTKIGNNDTGSPVYAVEFHQDSLYAAMGDKGLYVAPVAHPNLADPSAWTLETDSLLLPRGTCRFLAHGGGKIYTLVDESVYRKGRGGWDSVPQFLQTYRGYFDSENEIITCGWATIGEVWYPNDSMVRVSYAWNQTCAMAHDDFIWMGDASVGATRYKGGSYLDITPPGPLTSKSYKVLANNGEIYIAPVGRQGSLPSWDISGYFYYSKTKGWINRNIFTGTLDSSVFRGFSNGYFDVKNETAYLTSNGQGVVAVKHGDTLRSINGYNSGMVGLGPVDIRISGITMDSEGGLWVVTILGDADRTLNYGAPDGQWYSYQLPGSRPVAIEVDEYDNKWIVNEGGGVTVFSQNGTPGITSDDKRRTLTNTIANGALPTNDVLSIARDKEGHMWVGTTDGVTVFYDAFSVFTQDFPDGSCPVYENQCLLKFQKAKAITVDGANRKWIASENGAYLMSEDGTHLIHHFTSENSPLVSDNVYNITVDGVTGEVFFATEKGLVSYMGDATEGFDNVNELYAFPNPVYPDFQGEIIIRGMASGSKVRITTASGQVVREAESLGGQVTWDARDAWGNPVHSGIYLVMASDPDGNNAGVTKIAVLQKQ